MGIKRKVERASQKEENEQLRAAARTRLAADEVRAIMEKYDCRMEITHDIKILPR